jgi:hypothetical protein
MTRTMDKSKLYERLKEIAESKNGMLLSEQYFTAKTKYSFKCIKGHHFQLTADKVTGRGDWCPFCAGRYGDFQEKYRHIIEDLNNGVMFSPYIKGHVSITCSCEHGHVFDITPANLTHGKWCPDCRMSHGEKAIQYYLDKNNILYQRQFTFDDLKGNVHHLPFDFAIFDSHHNLLHLIEYDGEQHFRPMRHSSNLEKNISKFEKVQLNDMMKNDYCRVNDISLIRISFFDVDERRIDNLYRDIESILDEKLR